jgi:uncharacterized protein YciI
MATTFVVVRAAGPGWVGGVAMERQAGWLEHAKFMDALVEEGFVVLGGPLHGDGHRAMLVVRAPDEAAVCARLTADPWSRAELLQTTQVARWDLRLGELPP